MPAFAGPTTYTGSDTACFYGLLGSSCTAISGTSGIGIDLAGNPLLTYRPKSGFSTSGASTPIQVDLGTFTVARTLGGAEAGTFNLDVLFTQPTNAGAPEMYSASTLGAVALGIGGAEITFDQPAIEAFTGFDLSMPSSTITIAAGHSYSSTEQSSQ